MLWCCTAAGGPTDLPPERTHALQCPQVRLWLRRSAHPRRPPRLSLCQVSATAATPSWAAAAATTTLNAPANACPPARAGACKLAASTAGPNIPSCARRRSRAGSSPPTTSEHALVPWAAAAGCPPLPLRLPAAAGTNSFSLTSMILLSAGSSWSLLSPATQSRSIRSQIRRGAPAWRSSECRRCRWRVRVQTADPPPSSPLPLHLHAAMHPPAGRAQSSKQPASRLGRRERRWRAIARSYRSPASCTTPAVRIGHSGPLSFPPSL